MLNKILATTSTDLLHQELVKESIKATNSHPRRFTTLSSNYWICLVVL